MLVVTRFVLDQEKSASRPQARRRPVLKREENPKMLHKAQELKWVVLWILVTVFIFAIFIPTVNRALNL
jgi:hypothetical protein